MRATPALAAATSVVVAVAATVVVSWPVGLLAGVVVAAVAGEVVRRTRDASIRGLAADLRGWRRGPVRHQVAIPDDDALGDLVEALNATGAAFDRRLAEIADELPWRRQLVGALPTAAVLFGRDGYVAAANAAAHDLLGIPSDGEPTTMLSALGSSHLAAAVRATTPGRDPVTVDAEVSGRVVRATVTSIGDQRLVLVEDRTRERRVENLRRNFVVNASHELKTPAGSIQALVDALLVVRETDPARVPALLGRLEEESGRLVRLVHDLLDLRRLEDRVQVDPTPADLVSVVAGAVDDVADAAREHGVTVAVDAPPLVRVHCDPDDLRIIVRNLVTNGVQYNRRGGRLDIVVGPEPAAIRLEVRDTGIGIPKADLDRVFERFYRVDVARSRETGGTGLGLSLVRHAVGRNGGTVEVDSLLGSGTCFTVRLPRVDRQPLVAIDPVPERGRETTR